MKRRHVVRHPDSIHGPLLGPGGKGGPAPGPGGVLGPAHITNPIGPGSPPANAASNAVDQATKAIGDALGVGFGQSVQTIIPAGEVLLGIVLIAAGLLLASGQAGKVGRAGLFVATRGVVK